MLPSSCSWYVSAIAGDGADDVSALPRAYITNMSCPRSPGALPSPAHVVSMLGTGGNHTILASLWEVPRVASWSMATPSACLLLPSGRRRGGHRSLAQWHGAPLSQHASASCTRPGHPCSLLAQAVPSSSFRRGRQRQSEDVKRYRGRTRRGTSAPAGLRS